MKIIGYTVGTTLPKPNFKQTDPTKGDYIKGKEVLDEKYVKVDEFVAITPEEIDALFAE